VFAAGGMATALFAARLSRRWGAEPPAFEPRERRVRRRALVTLLAVAAAASMQPYCGACSPAGAAPASSALPAALDALVLAAATDSLC
jgi:hypothetical protein